MLVTTCSVRYKGTARAYVAANGGMPTKRQLKEALLEHGPIAVLFMLLVLAITTTQTELYLQIPLPALTLSLLWDGMITNIFLGGVAHGR